MKFRATLIAIREYEINFKNYNTNTVKDMIQIDRENFEDDPFTFITDADIVIKIEEIKND